MPYWLQQIAGHLSTWNWPEVLQGIGALWVALVATLALGAWKAQLRTEKELEFIYAITDAINEFLLEMPGPITHLELAQIGAKSHDGLGIKYREFPNPGAVEFIEKRGPEYGKKMLESLAPARPLLGHIQALATKGQMFNFPDVNVCLEITEQLSRVFGRAEAFAVMIGSDHMNWNNPHVQKTLSGALGVEAEDLRKSLEMQSRAITGYAKKIYQLALR